MKRTLALLLALVMVLSLAACGSRKAPAASTSPAADGSQSVSGKISCLTSNDWGDICMIPTSIPLTELLFILPPWWRWFPSSPAS